MFPSRIGRWKVRLDIRFKKCLPFVQDREMFSTYVACEGLVWMVNNTANRVVGKGTVQFHMTDERSLTLTEVRHVPNLRRKFVVQIINSRGDR